MLTIDFRAIDFRLLTVQYTPSPLRGEGWDEGDEGPDPPHLYPVEYIPERLFHGVNPMEYSLLIPLG